MGDVPEEDRPNGIGCPACGEELHDVSENWDKDGYECRSCDYKGFGA